MDEGGTLLISFGFGPKYKRFTKKIQHIGIDGRAIASSVDPGAALDYEVSHSLNLGSVAERPRLATGTVPAVVVRRLWFRSYPAARRLNVRGLDWLTTPLQRIYIYIYISPATPLFVVAGQTMRLCLPASTYIDGIAVV